MFLVKRVEYHPGDVFNLLLGKFLFSTLSPVRPSLVSDGEPANTPIGTYHDAVVVVVVVENCTRPVVVQRTNNSSNLYIYCYNGDVQTYGLYSSLTRHIGNRKCYDGYVFIF